MSSNTPKEHIEEIRRRKFSIGGEPNPLTEDLHQSVKNLSAELYAKDVHFLMEIIQNAEDNEYLEGVEPSLEFVVTSRDITATGAPATLLVFNNERGFAAKNIESICSVGRSTKKGHRQQQGYIGEKGIGFKSVFLITAQPYIFSSGYQIRFNENPCPQCNLGYIVPEWVDENPTVADIQEIYGSANAFPRTTLILPLKPDKEGRVKSQLSTIHPEILLFLSKIKRLSVREFKVDPGQATVTAISISTEKDFVTRKDVSAESYTLHLSAEENGDNNEGECRYHLWKQKFPVSQENKVDKRKGVEEWVITLAFPFGHRLNRGMGSPGIYAYLPTEMITNFPFIIQADFILSSSRESVHFDDKWNQGILACVSSAFIHAFRTLVKSSESAPVSTLISMFEFLPINNSTYPELNGVRDSIKQKLIEESIVPSESYLEQKYFCKPSEVCRVLPAFWSILLKARKYGVNLDSLPLHGKRPLSSAFDKQCYNNILTFLGVEYMDNEWYTKCIRSSNMVLGVPEDVYLELLFFLSDNWKSRFHSTSIRDVPLLKYVVQDGHVALWSLNEATQWTGKRICLSSDASQISWLIDWNKQFRCLVGYFVPRAMQDALQSFPKKETVLVWLKEHAEVSALSVNCFAERLLDSIKSDRGLVIVYAHFLYHSLSKEYLSEWGIGNLCKKMPLVDSYGSVTTQRSGVLVPANGSNWVRLMGSNPWRAKHFVELSEEYLHAGSYAGMYTSKMQLIKFLGSYIGASDIPNLCPPDESFPTVSSPLTRENTYLLLDWIRNLRRGTLKEGRFLRCIQEGSWLRTCLGSSVSHRPPSQSFLLATTGEQHLEIGYELVDIPLIDQSFYGNRINNYKEELKVLGVMFEFGEACRFMGKHLMSLAANSNLTRSNVFSVMKFIRLSREKYLPVEEFIKSIKGGTWIRTCHGVRSPLGSILFDSEWKDASDISDLPFIDHEYYGKDIFAYTVELKLLGVEIGFNEESYKLVADHFKMPTSITANAALFVLKCIRHITAPTEIVGILKNKKWLVTNAGSRAPGDCYLFKSEWGSLLNILNGFPLVSETFYGPTIASYENELKKLGVVVDFEEASKLFARQFKQHITSSSLTYETVISFLTCYRNLKKMSYQLPDELKNCIYEEKWLKTCLGYKSPKESILFNSEWEHLSVVASLPFINYGDKSDKGIHEFRHELKVFGVVVEFEKGSMFMVTGLNIPKSPSDVSPLSALSLLQCTRNLLKEHGSLPKDFSSRISKRWLKTHMGYRAPDKCLLFDSKWSSFVHLQDGPFIDETFYGAQIATYREELNAIGVVLDVKVGCHLLAEQLEAHSQFTVIARIYRSLNEFNWEPENKAARWIWIPDGNDRGEWVSPEECVLHDKDGLFALQLNVLETHYDKKLLSFFSMVLSVRHNPSVDDYCLLWNGWESSERQLTSAECSAFWVYIAKHWNSKTEKLLAEKLVKLPSSNASNSIYLLEKKDLFIPDDLQLKDIFEEASPDPLFVWYPKPSLPSVTLSKLHDIYSSIGVQTISSVLLKDKSSLPASVEFKQVDSRQAMIAKGLIRIILGFLAEPSMEMDAATRHKTVAYLLDLIVFETNEPITVRYSLTLSSGKTVEAKVSRMIRWERENSKLFTQKMERSAAKDRIVYATYFSEAIAEGLLWEKADKIAGLSELIKLGWLLEFEEGAVQFMMKSKNLQLFLEDEEFLNSSFSSSDSSPP